MIECTSGLASRQALAMRAPSTCGQTTHEHFHPRAAVGDDVPVFDLTAWYVTMGSIWGNLGIPADKSAGYNSNALAADRRSSSAW
jgi:hypothetical protein